MLALDCTHRIAVDDGLDALALAPTRTVRPRLDRALGPALWLAAAVAVAVVLRLAGGAGDLAAGALAGTAALVYLGTAVTSGRPGIALLDLSAALAAGGLAVSGAAPATVMGVHVLWGALRAGWNGSGGSLATGWAAFFGAQAVLLGLSA